MTTAIDSINIRGLRKAHLTQLAAYIRDRDDDGWYYGNREHFEKRHADLLKLAERLERIAGDPDVVIAKGERDG